MPIYNPPDRFPGSQHLPELAQTLLARLFPPDQLPTPGPIGMAAGPMGPQAPGRGMVESILPRGKSLNKAYPEMYGGSQVPGPPQAFGEYQKALDYLKSLLGSRQ